MSLENLATARIYLSDIKDFEAVNAAFLKYFTTGKPPAQATTAVARLPANLKIMTTFVAIKNKT